MSAVDDVVEQIKDALVNAFETDELVAFVRFKLEINPAELESPADVTREVFALAAVDYCRRRGNLARLVDEAKKERPGNPLVRALPAREQVAALTGEELLPLKQRTTSAISGSDDPPARSPLQAASQSVQDAQRSFSQSELTRADAQSGAAELAAPTGGTSAPRGLPLTRPGISRLGQGPSDPVVAMYVDRAFRTLREHIDAVIHEHTAQLQEFARPAPLPLGTDELVNTIEEQAVIIDTSDDPIGEFASILILATGGMHAAASEKPPNYRAMIDLANATTLAYESLAHVIISSPTPLLTEQQVANIVQQLKTYWALHVDLAEFEQHRARRGELGKPARNAASI
jgi:hypothetical protein